MRKIDVIDETAAAGDEPLIFHAPHRLTDPERYSMRRSGNRDQGSTLRNRDTSTPLSDPQPPGAVNAPKQACDSQVSVASGSACRERRASEEILRASSD
jgi:hypothetical protein